MEGGQCFSGRVLDLRSRGHLCDPHWRHCVAAVASLRARHFILCYVLVQPRKSPDMTEKWLAGM